MNFIFSAENSAPPDDVINSNSRKLHGKIVPDSFGHAESLGAIFETFGFSVAEIWVQTCEKVGRCDVTLHRQRGPVET